MLLAVSKENFSFYLLIIFISFWIFETLSFLPINYLMLVLFTLCLASISFLAKNWKISKAYINFLSLKVFYILLSFIVWGMLITLPISEYPVILTLKIILLMSLPILFIVSYFRIYKIDIISKLKTQIIVSSILHTIFLVVLGYYNSNIGKFLIKNKNLGYYSSNELSIYLVATIFVPAWIYFSKNKQKKLPLLFLSILPIIHFSKMHLVSYTFSLILSYLFSKRKRLFFLPIATVLILSLSYFTNHVYFNYYDNISNLQLKKLLLANWMLWSGSTEFYEFLSKVGDQTRKEIFENYSNWLNKTIFIGLGDKAKHVIGQGHDFHNMFFFYHIQYGLIAAIGFYGLLIYFLYIFLFKFKHLRFIATFFIVYMLLRSLMITINPYMIIIYCIFLITLEINLSRGSFNDKSNNISRC